MKLAFKRKSKTERAIDATSDLAKLWAGAKLTKGTARAGRKAARLKAVGSTRTGRRAAAGKALATSKPGRDAGRKVLGAALAVKAATDAAKGGRPESRGRRGRGRGRKLLVLGGTAGAVAIALKARKKGGSEDEAPAWTPPDVPVGGATVAGDTTAPGAVAATAPATVGTPTPLTVPPGPTSVAPADPPTPATLPEDPPNVGGTGLAPEAADEEADRS